MLLKRLSEQLWDEIYVLTKWDADKRHASLCSRANWDRLQFYTAVFHIFRITITEIILRSRSVPAAHVRCFCRRCDEKGCDGLLRPHVIWFGETLDSHILTKVEKELDTCDLCLVVSFRSNISHFWALLLSELNAVCRVWSPVSSVFLSVSQVGTSSVVYPAALFGAQVASRGIPVAEFNTKVTPNTPRFRWVHEQDEISHSLHLNRENMLFLNSNFTRDNGQRSGTSAAYYMNAY